MPFPPLQSGTEINKTFISKVNTLDTVVTQITRLGSWAARVTTSQVRISLGTWARYFVVACCSVHTEAYYWPIPYPRSPYKMCKRFTVMEQASLRNNPWKLKEKTRDIFTSFRFENRSVQAVCVCVYGKTHICTNTRGPFEKFVDWRQCAMLLLLCLHLHNSGALPPVHEIFKLSPYIYIYIYIRE
jgi:hypothetical protein